MRPGVRPSARLLCSAGILAAALVLCARDAVAQAVPWWDPSYASAREVTLTAGAAPLPAGSLVSLTLDHAALVAAGGSLSSGNDVRLVYRSGGIATEIPRALDNASAWNNAGTRILFKTQAALAAAASDANYFLYYGNPAAPVPSTAGVPTARTFKTEVLAEQSTASLTFTDVPGGTLTFTPGQASENWIVFVTGVLRSTSTGLLSSEMQLLANGTSVDVWGQRNRDGGTPNGSGFMIFHRVTGSATPQTLQLQFRADAGTTFAGSLRLVAALLPENADLRYIDTAAQVQLPKNTANAEIQALTFTPATAGDYYVFGKVSHWDPGGGTVQTWVEDDTGILHPDAPAGIHYSNPSTTFASVSAAFRKTLPASSRTFRIRGTTGGNNGSIWKNRKLMAFRADAWELQEYSEALAETSISASTALQTKNSLTTAAPPAARDYLVLQMARISGNADQTLQKSGVLLDGGVTLLRTDHRISNDSSVNTGYHHVAALVNVKTTAAAATYQNAFQSSSISNGDSVNCAESVIASFRYLQPTVAQRPLVRDVSSTALDAVYGAGAALLIQVRFSEVVTVTGTPLLTLETGAADAVLTYASGSGTNTLTFTYTVVLGHTSGDLDYPAAGSLALNGGTIRDAANLNAGLLLPAPGTPGSLGASKNLVIDAIPPGAPGLPVGAPNPSGPAGFTVTWPAATDSGGAGAGVVTYNVERSSNGGSTWGSAATGVAGTSLLQSGLAQGSYVYRVTAVDLGGNAGPLSGVSAPVFVDATAPVVSSITAGNPSPTNLASVTYTVTFSESVVAVDAADFTLPLTVAGAAISGVTGSGTTWTVTVNTGTGSGSLQLGLVAAPSIQDFVGNILVGPFPAAPIYTVDKTGPTVLSITRGHPSPTNLAGVSYVVTFSEPVFNVGAADFTLPLTVTGASIIGVLGAGSGWTVTVNTGTGSGSLQLALVAAPSIQDASGNNVVGPFPSAPVYTVDKVAPVVSSITAGNPSPTNLASVTYAVTFSEPVINVDTGDFTLPLTVTGAFISGVSGAGTAWTVTINTGTGSGSLQLALVASPSTPDAAGNNPVGPFPPAPIYTVDKSAPTVLSITAGSPSPTNLASVTYTVTFSEAVVNVDAADFTLPLTVAGAGISGVTGSGTNWTVTVNTGTGSGSLQLALVASPSIADATGNNVVGPFPAAPIYLIDKVAPTVSAITAGNTTPTNLASVTYAVTFSEPVFSVDATDFSLASTVTGASISGVTGAGTAWTVTINTGTGSGSLQLALVAAPTIPDAAGNNVVGPFPLAPVYTVDKSSPTVSSITAGNPSPTNLASITYVVTFSEAVTGVDTADFTLPLTVTGASISGVTGAGTTWTVTINTGTGSGTLQLALVAAPNIADAAGNNVVGPFPAAPIYTVDKSAPTVLSITAGSPSPTNLASVTYTVTFSEAVVNVDAGDFSLPVAVAGATIGGVTGSGTTWTVTVNTGTGSGNLQLALVAAPTIQDTVGDALVGPFPPAPTYLIDKVAPVASSITAGNPLPTNLASVTYTVTFSESVTGVDAADFTLPLTVVGATISSVTGSGTTWTVTINTGTGAGSLQLALVASPTIPDAAGNNVVGPFPPAPIYSVDKTAPTVSAITAGNPTPTNLASVTYTVTFSESVTGVDVADFTLPLTVTGATINGVSGSGTTWTVTINTGTGSGSLQLALVAAPTIVDASGNTVVGPFPAAPIYTVDKVAPTVLSITAGNTTPTNLASVTYTVTFSEAVVNVDAGDFSLPLTVTGASISGVTGAGTTWTVTINTGTGSGSLQLALVAAPTIVDASGNTVVGPFPAAPIYTVDKVAPTVSSITAGNPSPTNLASVTYIVTFSEAVTGVDAADFTLPLTVTGAAISGVTGAGTTWTVTINTGTGSGTLQLALVAAPTIPDAAGNNVVGPFPAAPIYTVDKVAPTVLSITAGNPSPTNLASVTYIVTFSEAVVNVDAADFTLPLTVTGASISGVSGAGTTWTVTINTGTGSGSLQVALIAAPTIQDTVGDALVGPFPAAPIYTVDKSSPTVLSITAGSPSPTNLASVTYTVTFSEAVVNVDAADFTLPLTVAGATISGVTGSGTTWTVTINTGTGSGTLQLALVAAPTIQDALGDALVGPFPSAPTYVIDKTAPVASSIVLVTPSPTNLGTITTTVTFSKSVTGVDSGDFALALAGVAGASISGVSGAGTTWTVTILTGTGDGTITLKLVDDDSIQDSLGNGLGGPGLGNGNLDGPACTIDKTPPTVSLSGPSVTPTITGPVSFTVTYGGATTFTLALADVSLNSTGTATGTLSLAPAGPSTYTVTISAISGAGTVGISIAAGTAADAAGNSAPAAGPSATAVVEELGVIGLPTALETEFQTNPGGLLRVPRFSAVHNWLNTLPLNAVTYKIQVSTDASFGTITHWDSPAGQPFPGAASVAPGARSPLILYGAAGAAPALQWNSQYYWRTRFGDSGGGLSGFSTEPASFFMGVPAASSSANGNGNPGADSFRYIGFPIAVGSSVPATELLRSVSYVFRWEEPTRQYVQITAADVIEGGRGYLAYAPPGTIINLMMGSVPVGNQPMNLSYTTLGAPAGPEITEGRPAEYYRGAHFVANPFNESISWNNPPTGLVDKPNLSETYFKWDGFQYLTYNSATQLGAAGATIAPFQAFGVNVLAATAGADLVFNAPASSNPPMFQKAMMAVADTEAWSLHIVATAAGAEDTENYLGVHPQSQDAWDRRDGEEPGHAAATWVNFYLDHTDWTARPRCYTHDYRKTPTHQDDEVVWDATVETNSGSPVTLTWPGFAQLPLSDWTFSIEDPTAGTTTDLSMASSIQLSAFTGKRPVRIVAHRTRSAPGLLEVSMVAGGSPPGTVPAGTSDVLLMDVDVIAHGEAVTVGKLIVRHAGTGDPTGVLVSLFDGAQRLAGPTALGGAGEIVWTGLGRSIAEGSLQTWSLVYDFPADSSGTYRATLLAQEVEGVGNSSGRTLHPASAALVSPEVTVTAGTATTTTTTTGTRSHSSGGRCGLLGVEFLLIMALIRRWRSREEVGHVRV